MSELKRNIIANYTGHVWTSLMGFVFTPIYIAFMGIESFGIVGFGSALGALFFVIDMGLGTTVTRKMAGLPSAEDGSSRAADFVRTFEYIYWIGAIILAAVLWALSGVIARHWLRPGELSPATVSEAIAVVGLSLACRWPCSLYAGALMGLEKQVLFNWIVGTAATVRGAGSVLVLWLISPTIQAFLVWRVIADTAQTMIAAYCLWKSMPPSPDKPGFDRKALTEGWRFSAGMGTTGLFFVLFSEMDKIVLSRMLPLETFGYYSFASMAAGVLLGLVNPVTAAVFPRLARLAATGDTEALRRIYHKSAQLVSVVSLPVTVVVVLFSGEIVLAWTGKPDLADKTGLLLSILIAGFGICGVLRPPHALQMAYGWTSLGAWVNGISAGIGIPLLIIAAGRYAATGGALVWPLLNLCQVAITLSLMHARILTGEMRTWYVTDVGLPLAACFIAGAFARYWVPAGMPRLESALVVAGVLGLSWLAAMFAAPDVRIWLKRRIFDPIPGEMVR